MRASEQRLRHLISHTSTGGFGLAADDAQVTAEQQKLDALREEVKRLNALHDERRSLASDAAMLTEAAEHYVRATISQRGLNPMHRHGVVLDAHKQAAPRLAKGESVTDRIATLRAEIATLQAEADRLPTLPLPLSDRRANLKKTIRDLAAQGAPQVNPINGAVQWPEERLRSAVYVVRPEPPKPDDDNDDGSSDANARYRRSGRSGRDPWEKAISDINRKVADDRGAGAPPITLHAPGADGFSSTFTVNALALLAFLHEDALFTRLSAALAPDERGAAMSENERTKRLGEIADVLLDLQRQEVYWVEEAAQQGTIIAMRADTPPSVVLHLG